MEELMEGPAAGVMYTSYTDYKGALDGELQNTAESFVRIGYLLKLAKEKPALLEGSGYANVNEFAQAEYNIDKTMVSRFMNINTRFSEGGFSECLKEQYRGFGYAKLSMMLQLPEELTEEISAEYTKSEIQAIKEEYDEEKKVSDIEVLIEGEKEEQRELTVLEKVIHQLGHDEPELYAQLHGAVNHAAGAAELYEVLAPAGESMYSVRVQGVGRLMLSVKAADKDIVLINIRSNEKEQYDWNSVAAALLRIMPHKDTKTAWQAVYGEEYPEKKAEVAPVQPVSAPETEKAEPKKPEVKKKTKVTKAKPKEEQKEEPQIPEPEEQVPGQTDIETDFPEFAPEREPESVINTECGEDFEASGETGPGKTPEAAEVPNAEGIPEDSLAELKKKLHGVWDAAREGDFENAEELLCAAKEILQRMRMESKEACNRC